MSKLRRRNFIKASGLSIIPAFFPSSVAWAGVPQHLPQADTPVTNFFADGELLNTPEYVARLQQVNASVPIEPDRYGVGGCVAALEKKFSDITGKEKAVFMPTGTMANQLAIKVLSGENSKIYVQETSHVFRDEADAAQSVHNKRLIPLAKGETYFTAEELNQSVNYHNEGEAFKTGVGTVSIENPVRRSNGKMIPLEELKKIVEYCRQHNFKMHLDGARLYMASTWAGISIKEYTSLFDTVYISLYKYLGASAGAMLCGDKVVINKMEHLIKIYGGSMYRNWTNAAMALHHVEGFEERLQQARKRAEALFVLLNGLREIKITSLPWGTNIYNMQLTGVNGDKFKSTLAKTGIRIGSYDRLTINETILYRDNATIFSAFKEALKFTAL